MIKLYLKDINNSKDPSINFTRKILGEHLALAGHTLVIDKNEFGKPYLTNYPDIHFNISHTKAYILCAVAQMPVGVDIEKVKHFNNRIPERFFTKNERDYILSSHIEREERFAEIWTRKEAYVKWVGKGMVIPFESFDVLKQKNIHSLSYLDCYISICSDELIQAEENNEVIIIE